jgi:tRNA dimethylallyltransferase
MNTQSLRLRLKLLVVCGTTATGKTDLALQLAKKFKGELVSADSRQVYKHMNIGTGKDIPEDFWLETSNIPFQGQKIVYYTNGKTRIWGYDLVHPKSEFSVAQYVDAAHAIISHIHNDGKLPILVGGTGLYIKAVVDGVGTSIVPKNEKLRNKLEMETVDNLQMMLRKLDRTRFDAMNSSDSQNSRRLIRAIEIASFDGEIIVKNEPKYNCLFVGLKIKKDVLDERINHRVETRLKAGQRQEVSGLIEKGIHWTDQSMSSIGYKEWKKYFAKEISLSDVSSLWKLHERKYAKRQKTWFKKEERIHWFSADKAIAKKVERLVSSWYKKL